MSENENVDVYQFPVSTTQAAFWFMYQLDRSSTAYTIPLCFRIEGELDKALLKSAVDSVVARHEILRTLYEEVEDGQLVQSVYSSIEVPF